MTASIPNSEPLVFEKGITVKWTKSLSDYKPENGWVLKYSFVQSGSQRSVTATDNGDSTFLTTIDVATSVLFNTGIYHWQAFVTKGGERYKVAEGSLEVKPDFETLTTGYDARSHVAKVLAAIEAVMEKKATKDQLSYTIEGVSLERMPPEQLIKWRNQYQIEYNRELQAERINAGNSPGNIIKVRF